MKLKDYLLPEIEREIDKSSRALGQVPADKYDWKPHEKSMAFGYLVNMVATIPTWITLQVNQDELDIAPADGWNMQQNRLNTSDELLKSLDEVAASVRGAFQKNAKTLTKGTHVMVQGSLRSREFEKDGVSRRVSEVRAETIAKLERVQRGEAQEVPES